ncbi:MAG: phosphoglycerate kinase [Candidatus Sericytochromatia bacterium]|nr:phosphoglycerate kinase [Candidatus Sericytochromatia bacterium]
MPGFRSLADLGPADLKGKRVLVREDLNVPLADGKPTDDTRIRAALPTIRHLVAGGARVVVAAHLGRPKGHDAKLTLAPVATHLAGLLGQSVKLAPGVVGPEVEAAVAALADGEVLLLENVRFHPEEEANEPGFVAALARLGDLYVNDAFGTAHRAHGSTAGVADHLPAYAGFLMARELEVLGGLLEQPGRPFWAIIGGSKVSSKIGVLEHLLGKVDGMVIGGAMAFTFWKAMGKPVGKSLVEDDQIPVALRVLEAAKASGTTLLLPTDTLVGTDPKGEVTGTFTDADMPADAIGLDVGPASVDAIRAALSGAETILWNGPLGVFENPAFAAGTLAVAAMLAERTAAGARTVVGGGDSVAALEQSGLADKVTHVSTGGGASLEFLEGQVLPGVAALEKAALSSSRA